MPSERFDKVRAYLVENDFITNREARELLGLSDSTVLKLLKSMIEAGWISPVGNNKNRKYFLKDKE
jgi:DNA-binding MarR family transcriptional regulator